MPKIFISYRSLDSAKVDAVVARISSIKQADGTSRYTPWQDKYGIPVGQDWWQSIVDAIIDCDYFMFMVSRESVKNSNCRAELSYARRRNRPIIPFVLDGEYAYNPITGKNDIDYWSDVPQELNDLRAQFLFYEGASFFSHLETAVQAFAADLGSWRDIVAPRPTDPRDASDETNTTIMLYDKACDYAWRCEISTAEVLFLKLVKLKDSGFREEAHQWIELLRKYQELLSWDAQQSTRFRVKQGWVNYLKLFPKHFLEDIFDPKDINARFSSTNNVLVAKPTRPPVIKTATPDPDAKATTFQNRFASLTQRFGSTRQRDAEASDHTLAVLPQPFAWMLITAGTVTLEEGGYVPKGGKTFPVEAFQIAKYPLTNAQFGLFIDDQGYQIKDYWTAAGWRAKEYEKWNQPRYWDDSKWNQSHYPVVGVSWYEAVAFCRWISRKSGHKIRLPTEQEWQRAAQGDQGFIYPWGNEWDVRRCNNNLTHFKFNGATTPVTQFEGKDKGNSPFGVVDMSGNVREWCSTTYRIGESDLIRAYFLVLRGGAWGDLNSDVFRTDFRYGITPFNRDDHVGFRLARSY